MLRSLFGLRGRCKKYQLRTTDRTRRGVVGIVVMEIVRMQQVDSIMAMLVKQAPRP